MIEAKDAEIAVLRAELDAALERYRRLELRVAELERRLAMDSTDSGTPSSKEGIGAKEAQGGRGSRNRSGSGARTASGAVSPGTRARAWSGIRTR